MTAVPAPPTAIPLEEIERRIARVRRRAAAEGLGAVLSYGDCWRSANVRYFTDFRPVDGVHDIALALLVLPLDGEPVLLVGDGTLDYAREVSTFRVETFGSLEQTFTDLLAAQGAGPVGLAGHGLIPAHLHERCTAALGGAPLVPTSAVALEKARKSAWELGQLREAARITDLAMDAIRTALENNGPMSERDMARVADIAMIEAGADGPAYLSMVQSGPRAAFSLALPTNRVVRPGEMVMTDIGARYGNYVADGGRGFAYGSVTRQQRDIIDTAADAVEVGLETARAGITADELNKVMQAVLVERGYAPYSSEAMGRGTGHGTGMDPEEELPWIGPGNETVLEEDMVFTLKATINVPEVGGLRTERIVRVTQDGVEPLDNFPMRNFW
ncbi:MULTISPECIES: Xaa-Pro peptidase family protein [unclassified Micromonospora]|uniref:M24 family metallopeptidase n=1 Tax=unclassified Micromonospora TaxID=2617518 RepID=UPI0033AE5ED7